VIVTPFSVAYRFLGLKEVAGHASSPQVLAMLQITDPSVQDDDVPWCSGFLNYICWLLNCQRSGSLAARSWLKVGRPITIEQAEPDCDVVILSRGAGPQPGPDVIAAPGHVGFFAGLDPAHGAVSLLGGNQGDAVSVASFPTPRILGIRRIA